VCTYTNNLFDKQLGGQYFLTSSSGLNTGLTTRTLPVHTAYLKLTVEVNLKDTYTDNQDTHLDCSRRSPWTTPHLDSVLGFIGTHRPPSPVLRPLALVSLFSMYFYSVSVYRSTSVMCFLFVHIPCLLPQC
jgi:hypothetical protein